MSETTITVGEAARDFLRVLDRVERGGAPATLLREGRPVATLNPIPSAALTCAELADRWLKLEKLAADEARVFADDVEHSRSNVPPLTSAWD